MTWTIAVLDVDCGSCGTRIPADAVVLLLTLARKVRCESCAHALGYAVDAAEVAQERWRVAEDRRRERMVDAPGRPHAATRWPPIRQPLPLSAIGSSLFDAKAAAAGERADRVRR
jgi:hypothetical protein